MTRGCEGLTGEVQGVTGKCGAGGVGTSLPYRVPCLSVNAWLQSDESACISASSRWKRTCPESCWQGELPGSGPRRGPGLLASVTLHRLLCSAGTCCALGVAGQELGFQKLGFRMWALVSVAQWAPGREAPLQGADAGRG